MNAEETLARYASQIEEALVEALPSAPDTPPDLLKALRYSLMAGGKRLRPILVLLAAEACGADLRDAMPAACAVEMVHTYSLIHDDLPAMDDDDLRRGQPTSHVAFGEAMAILAGAALLTRAFEVLAADLPDPVVAAECCRVLASAGGSDGMVGGQVADLAATDTSPESVDDPLQVLGAIHRRKTGRLLAASLELGAVVAGANIQVRESLLDYGQQVGLAFQVADDLLDVEGDINRTGKTSGRDAHLGKWTYPALAGNDTSRRLARNCIASACAAVEPLGESGEPLKVLAEFVIERDH